MREFVSPFQMCQPGVGDSGFIELNLGEGGQPSGWIGSDLTEDS